VSITNLGNQYITFDYRHPATAKDFNTLLKGAIKPGIYSGGTITITGANTISIAPFIAYLYSSTDKLVRVETRTAVALTIAESTPVLSITFPWANVAENWLDWNQRAHASAVITNEVCLGEMVFVANAINSIDYTVKNWGKQLISNVIDGISPMSITSETLVEHLNADMVDDAHKSIDGTFASNSDLLIPTEKAVKTYVDDYTMRYDYVIDSQDKFDALVANSTWLGAKNVLFTTNVTRAAQTTIPATVEKIHAINGATLTVTDLTTEQYGFGYATVPTDPKFEVRNFAVNATGTGLIYGFYNCTQLTSCTGTGIGSGVGFYSCTQLTNCTGTGTGTGSGSGYGFNNCTQLTNCTGTGTGSGYGSGYGFNNCTQLTNCTGTGIGTGTGPSAGYGFYGCKKCMCNKAGEDSTTATYNTSYATAYVSAPNACADTADGGYNS
jgi:hypothetical protein